MLRSLQVARLVGNINITRTRARYLPYIFMRAFYQLLDKQV